MDGMMRVRHRVTHALDGYKIRFHALALGVNVQYHAYVVCV